MNGTLYTYALIRVFYDKGHDYIDSFWPLVLLVLPRERKYLSAEEIQRDVASKYGLNIPQHALSVIATRAKRQGFLTPHHGSYALTQEGVSHLDSMEPERDVERRINEMVEDASGYLSQKLERVFSRDQVASLMRAFIAEHIELFEDFIHPESAHELGSTQEPLPREEAALLDYFVEVERNRPALFDTLRDLVRGSIISAIIHSESFADATRHFERTQVYLDSNFVFSILGLHHDEFNKPAQELFEIMRAEKGLELRVFDFTIDEIVSVLKAFPSEQHIYLPDIRVASIHSSLKAKGWTPSFARQYILRIEDEISKLGIRITRTKIDLNQYIVENPELISKLFKYKPEQTARGQNHDLAAIQQVKEIRGGPVRQLEMARGLFLTSDMRLARYNILEGFHKERATIAEVVADRVMTNILWLKNPKLLRKLQLGSIIAMHSRHLFIQTDVWRRFFETVRQLRSSGKIDQRDAAILLYDQRVQDMLRSDRPGEVGKIGPEWVLGNVESARNRVAAEMVAKLERQKIDFDTRLRDLERQKTDEFLQAVEKAKTTIQNDARARALLVTNAVMALLLIIVGLMATWISPHVVRSWDWLEPRVWLVGVVVAICFWLFGVKADRFQARTKLEERFFWRFYRRGLKHSKLEQIEEDISKGSSLT
jgi:hypothetical protein